MFKITKRHTTIAITVSVLLLLAAAFLYAGYHLAPKTFENGTPEKNKLYRIVMECLFYTGLLGLADSIWRRYRINKKTQCPDSQQITHPRRQAVNELLYYTGIEGLLHRIRKPKANQQLKEGPHSDKNTTQTPQ